MKYGTRIEFTKDHEQFYKGQVLQSVGEVRAQTTFIDPITGAATIIYEDEFAALPFKDVTVDNSVKIGTSKNEKETVDTKDKK